MATQRRAPKARKDARGRGGAPKGQAAAPGGFLTALVVFMLPLALAALGHCLEIVGKRTIQLKLFDAGVAPVRSAALDSFRDGLRASREEAAAAEAREAFPDASAAAAGGAAAFDDSPGAPKRVEDVSSAVRISASVDEAVWSDDESFLRDIVLRRRPVVIKNAPEGPWTQWGLESFREALPTLEEVRYQKSGVFTLRGERDEGGMLDEPTGGSGVRTLAALSTGVFLDTAEEDGHFLYWTGSAEKLRGSALHMAASNDSAKDEAWRLWAVKEVQLDDNSDAFGDVDVDDIIVPMLWLSHPGVVAQAHYDRSHNFVTQVLGEKRWLIFPPTAHRRLYPFPHLHPAYKQSQVDFSAPDLSAFPSFDRVPALEARVGPGEVLYMPPFWFHRVESLSTSLSLSVISPSEEELVLSEAYWKDLPLGDLQGDAERAVGARLYLEEFLSRLEGAKSPKWFAERLYEHRYAALYPEDSAYYRQNVHRFDCYSAATDALTGAPLAESVRNAVGHKNLQEAAAFVADCANDAAIPPAVREQWAQSYVEEIARWAMQTPEDALPFIRKCLVRDTKVDVPKEVEWVEGPEVLSVGSSASRGNWIDPRSRRRMSRKMKAMKKASQGRPAVKEDL